MGKGRKEGGQDDSLPIEAPTLMAVRPFKQFGQATPPRLQAEFRGSCLAVHGSTAQAAGWVTCLIQEFIDMEEQ